MADQDEETKGASDAQLISEMQIRESEVTSLLNKRDKSRALFVSLQNPPMSAKSIEIKDSNAAIIEKVLGAITDLELGGILDELDPDSSDILMKYIYRFMGKSTNCGSMLKIHSLLSDKAGLGSIVRTLTDRKTV